MQAQHRTWIIGASTGIGKALAQELASQGHAIALSARDEAALSQLCEELPVYTADQTGDSHLVAPLDVSSHASIVAAKQHILSHWPQIDRVIFMAGIYQPMAMGELDIAETQKIININLLGAFYVAEIVLPDLLKQQHSQLVFCASVAGYRGLPRSQPYGASKAGLINMVESLRAEHGKQLDIRVINPGFVESRLTDKNDFHMPMRISAEQAAKAIAKGLNSRRFEIHFPKRFTFTMKLLSALPYWLYFKIMGGR